MKIETSALQVYMAQLTINRTATRNHNTNTQTTYAEVEESLVAPTAPNKQTHYTSELLLLLQGTPKYAQYVTETAQYDILTEAERQYLLSGDTQYIEKKSPNLHS